MEQGAWKSPMMARRYIRDANLFRHNAAGDRLSLELMTTAGNRSRETVQQVLQSQWRKLGIEVRIRNEPARVLFGQTLKQRQYTGMAMYAWISAPESLPRRTIPPTP